MPKKINLGSHRDLRRIMLTPLSELEYMSFSEAKKLAQKSEIATVHIYPADCRSRKPHSLMNLHESFYHQAYLFLEGGELHYNFSHGGGSSMRELHNQMIDYFFHDKDLRRRTTSAVIVTDHGHIASYYFYQGYSYANHDIGSNFETDISQKLANVKMPYSRWMPSEDGFRSGSVIFKHRGDEKIIHLSTKYDLVDKRFQKKVIKGIFKF